MGYDPDKHHRRSIRLPQFDYAQRGVYFVTICTHERECVLGEVIDGVMILNDWGIVADRSWDETSTHFDGVAIDAHVIMPNHMHANIAIVHDRIHRGEVSAPAPAIRRVTDQGGGTHGL
jgi:putative transposase